MYTYIRKDKTLQNHEKGLVFISSSVSKNKLQLQIKNIFSKLHQ